MAELAVRTVFSLAVVLGLLLLLARLAGRRYRGGAGAVRVVQRQSLSRSSAVTVVAVGRRTLVLGVTEHEVRVLAELAPGDLEPADEPVDPSTATHAATHAATQAATHAGPPVGRLSVVGSRSATIVSTGGVPGVPGVPVVPAATSAEPEPGFAELLLRRAEEQAAGGRAGSAVPWAEDRAPASAPAAASASGARHRAARAARTSPAPGSQAPAGPGAGSGPLAGSLLSPQTWRQTWQAVGRRAS